MRLQGSRRRVLAYLMLVALGGCASAQNRPWALVELQREDGSWSAGESGGVARGDVRASALMVTFLLSAGPLQEEAQREALTRGVRWLLRGLDQHGRLGFSSEPDWLLDHAIATHALLEALRLEPSSGGITREAVVRAYRALESGLAQSRAPSMELRLWSRMCWSVAQALSIHGTDFARLRWETTEANSSAQALAAALYDMLANGRKLGDEALLASVPKNLMEDPMAMIYATTLAFLQGGRALTRMNALVDTSVRKAARNCTEGSAQWPWEGVGSFGAVYGAAGASACAWIGLNIYYRANRLLVCS